MQHACTQHACVRVWAFKMAAAAAGSDHGDHDSSNPLEVYRRRAVFNVKEMAVVLEGEGVVTTRNMIWATMAADPLFTAPHTHQLTLEETRLLAFQWERRIQEYNFLSAEEIAGDPNKLLAGIQALAMFDTNSMRIGGNVCCTDQPIFLSLAC